MQITELRSILSSLQKIGIKRCVFTPSEEGLRISGSSKDDNVIVFDTIDTDIIDVPMGVNDISALLSRVDLFDDSATIVVDSSDCVDSLTIKKARKKVTFHCQEPSTLTVPKKIPPLSPDTESVKLSEEYVTTLNKVVSSISKTGNKKEANISIDITDGNVKLTVYDGEHDSFVDDIEIDITQTAQASFETSAFTHILKESLTDDGVEFIISDFGFAVFAVDGIDVIVAPLG